MRLNCVITVFNYYNYIRLFTINESKTKYIRQCEMYLKLRINIFAHCWDKRSFITVSAKTWQGESTQVSKIALYLGGTRLPKCSSLKIDLDIVFHIYSVGF